MSEYDWHPVVPLRWSVGGKLQQQFKRRVSNDRGVWYDEFEWRDVPRQSVDEIPVFPYPTQETRPALSIKEEVAECPLVGCPIMGPHEHTVGGPCENR